MKTKEEVELFFELLNLHKMYNKRNDKIYERSPGGEHEVMHGKNLEWYNKALDLYLKKANEKNST